MKVITGSSFLSQLTLNRNMGFTESSYGGYNHVVDPVTLSVKLEKISNMIGYFHGLFSSVAIKSVRIKTESWQKALDEEDKI